MPQSPESFTDEALYELIETADQDALEQMEADRIQELARDILWSAIEEYNLQITVCRYEEDKDAALEECIDYIIDENVANVQSLDTPDERYNAAVEIAEGLWSSQENVLERLVVCIELQLMEQPFDPNASRPDNSTRKKRFIADLIAEDNLTDTYNELANVVLRGDPLDLNDDADIDICVAALKELDTINQTPRRQLYYQLREILGVPFDGLLPGIKYSEERAVTFAQLDDAAEEIQMATVLYTGTKHIGARHKEISEIMAEFMITDPRLRQALFDATDSYNGLDLSSL